MGSCRHILIASDIHYACAAEQARAGHEFKTVKNPFLKLALRFYRDFFWLKNPTKQNHLLDQFLDKAGTPDLVIGNGDFTMNTAGVGVSDDAACQSALEGLNKLREKFGPKFHAVFGDHELGKIRLAGNQGGMQLESWRRAISELGLKPFWKLELGNYHFIGVVSSLIALPIFEPDTLPEERAEWYRLREIHLAEIRAAFADLKPGQKVILFCHDPTALPFLWQEEAVRTRLSQVEQTIIGHLHSPLILWKSWLLAGMPIIRFMGNSVRRFSAALNQAKHWKPFHVRLCPSLSGIELLKDGGFLSVELDPEGREPARFQQHKIDR